MNFMSRRDTKNGRVYTYEGRDYPSVTSILKAGIPKPALIKWAARKTAEAAMGDLQALAELEFSKGVTLLTGAHEKVRSDSAALGAHVHAQAEAYSTGQPLPPASEEVASYARAFDQFMTDFQPELELVEATVYSDQYGYAGTLDLRGLVQGRRYTIDTKSGRGIYPDVALQVVAYDRADFAVVKGERIDLKPTKRGLVLHLKPDEYNLHPVRVDDEVFDAFLAAYDMFTWLTDTSKSVIREPMNATIRGD